MTSAPVPNPILNIPMSALQGLCPHYLSPPQVVCEEKRWRYLNVRVNLLWLLHRSLSCVVTANIHMNR